MPPLFSDGVSFRFTLRPIFLLFFYKCLHFFWTDFLASLHELEHTRDPLDLVYMYTGKRGAPTALSVLAGVGHDTCTHPRVHTPECKAWARQGCMQCMRWCHSRGAPGPVRLGPTRVARHCLALQSAGAPMRSQTPTPYACAPRLSAREPERSSVTRALV